MAITAKQLPGPKGYPIVGSALSIDISNMHNQIEELAAEYGPVFRLKLITNSLIIVTDTDIVQYILKDRPEGFIRMSKVDRILRRQGVHGVFNAEGEEWKQHRRVITKGLDVKHQKAFFDQMLISVERLHQKWSNDADLGEPINIQQDFLRFTVDITTSLAFGYDMNTIEQKRGAVQDHLEKIFPMIFKRINDPVQWHLLIRSKKDRAYDKALVEIYRYIDQFILDGKRRLEENPELYEHPTNCLEAILVEAEKEDGFDNEEVRGNLMTLLLAGQDTTAHTLAWSIFMLTKDAKYQEALKAEADQVLGAESWITDYESTNQFKYTEALAYETMRVKPVAPLLLFEPIEDIEIKGHFFKKGSQILIESRYAAMLEDNFTDAQEYKPERWIRESKCPMHNMDAYIPFGGGPRYCPGKNLAILEFKLAISMLFKNFHLEMITPHDEVSEIMAFTMMASDYKVRLTHRS